MNIETMLNEEIRNELEALKETPSDTEEFDRVSRNVTQLIDRAIELEKINVDCEMKQKQMDEDKKDRRVRNGIAVAGIVVPSLLTIWGTLKSFEFEKEGTVTTILGRGFLNKLLPKK